MSEKSLREKAMKANVARTEISGKYNTRWTPNAVDKFQDTTPCPYTKKTANDYIRKLQKERIRTHEKRNYKFSENEILFDVQSYIDDTYSSHYAKEPKQATELIIENGLGDGFCIGNILKYAQRYGKKDGHNKNDLFKVIHYAIIQLSQDHYK